MKKILILILFSINIFLYAQTGTLNGVVNDNLGNPLIGANIIIEGTLLGTATNSDGKFKVVKIKNGKYRIKASMIGYKNYRSDFIEINNDKKELTIELTPTSYQYDQLVISANKFDQDLREISTSSYVIDSKIFSDKNYQKIDDAFRYVPGITMTQDQISIRGSSGYSRGAGTRVLVAIDGIPIYTPDTGEIIWELIPINDIERIEILKGASSSLYGSSAIGGVINILTKEITSNPLTFVKLQGGIYDKPTFTEWQWTNKTLSFNSQSISHSQSIGKLSLSVSLSRLEDLSYRKNDEQLRYSAFIKANYNFSESTTLSIWGTGYTREKGTFIYWKDLGNALIPPDTDLGQSVKSDRTIMGINLKHIYDDKLSISFIPSVYISYWKDQSEGNNKSSSRLYRSELRANYSHSENANIVSGIEFQHNDIGSTIFGNRNANTIGIFSQLDYKIINPLNLSFGIRFDNTKLENLKSEYSFSPKLGLNYKYDKNTYLRASIGKGFRSPSLAEAFTSTTTSGVTVKPNPNLKSETSYSMEVGVNHNFYNLVSFDLAIFNNEFFDMIEPGFDPVDGQLFFNNLTRARIQGVDINTTTSIIPQHLIMNLGYNYLWAIDVDKNISLKYRPKQNAIIGLNYNHNIFETGIDFRYMSRVEKIDNELVDLGLVPDGNERVDIIILDARLGVNLFSQNIPGRIFL
ncbi:MAG: TonB-dependent receptor, partial [Ignavibacteriae bacterium]|nr:TonB-dependent receptor [Ignavibacteriota bacterium]